MDPPERVALSFGDRTVTYVQLRNAAVDVAVRAARFGRVVVFATRTPETCVGVVGALLAGTPAVPVNPKLGTRELAHVLQDSRPEAVVTARDQELPLLLRDLPRIGVDLQAPEAEVPAEPEPASPALIFYTSGTTGPPKGVVLPRRAVSSNLDDLSVVWGWTPGDVLTHGLPLFHVHGLVLGMLGPVRVGASLRHTERFSAQAICDQLERGATMVFGVPMMYLHLAEAAEADPGAARALVRARLLVSGSAPLPVRDFERIERATGQRIVERYGLTETLMNCAVRADGDRRPGYVGPPLPSVGVRLVDEGDRPVEATDDDTMGQILVRGPNLFLEYLNRPDAMAASFRDGWFRTGDLGTRSADGYLRIVGRLSTDLIKSGGFKVGAGEVEAALLEHPKVAEAAVTGEPDERLGERIVAWVVPRGEPPSEKELEDHVADLLAPHKRPRRVRFLSELPRNEMGKVLKSALRSGDEG
jgi:malonyl-CoA/methylmalonyl-CoA synthetase